VALDAVLGGGDGLLEFLLDDEAVVVEDVFEVEDFEFGEGLPLAGDVAEGVDDVEAELQALDDEFVEEAPDERVQFGLQAVLDLAAHVLDERVDQLEAVEFALEGRLAALVEGLLQDEAGLLFLRAPALLLCELLDLCY
jgi:hypothetical protein